MVLQEGNRGEVKPLIGSFAKPAVANRAFPWKTFGWARRNIERAGRGNLKSRLVLAGFLLCSLLFIPPAFASPSIVNINVDSKEDMANLNAMLIDGFSESILKAIDSGIPMTFTYKIELREISPFWIDSLVSETTVRNTVHYDPLKDVYRFSSIGKNVQNKIITRDANLYQKLMVTLENIPLISLRNLDPDQKYYVRVKADLETDRFWFPFNHIFFFVPFNNVKASWAVSSPLAWQSNRERVMGPAPSKGASLKRSGKPKILDHVLRTFN